MNDVSVSVSSLPGVGKVRAQKLEKLGIRTTDDLLHYYPRAYENRGNVILLKDAEPEENAAFVLTVASEVSTARLRGNLTVSKFRAFDDSGSVEVVFFNAPFVREVFHIGKVFRFYGKLHPQKSRFQLTGPKYEPVTEGKPLPDFLPIYPQTDGINSKLISSLITSCFDRTATRYEDFLPENIRLIHELPSLFTALKQIHFPTSEKELSRAVARLGYDEMLLFALSVGTVREKRKDVVGHRLCAVPWEPLLSRLPFSLTDAQMRAVKEIEHDMVGEGGASLPPMSRILVGDVGCGKTVCAEFALYFATASGAQAALMAPTEILATQHYAEIRPLFSALGIRAELLLGSTTQKEKQRIYAGLADGNVSIVVGTHALLSDKVAFRDLALIVTDEQHRFGVAQRAVLKERVRDAHMLVMSATPIPRTLALALYGDLDVSRIDEMPHGRQKVDTFVVDESYRSRIIAFIRKNAEMGNQCYIVCPAIEKNDDEEEEGVVFTASSFRRQEKPPMKNATEYTEMLRAALPDIRIDCLHGKMKQKEKDAVMEKFVRGETSVLVSTTVIEVGVNVKNAALMIVEDADRFGLSQLHQLRGRVGRGSKKSYCILVSDAKSEKAKERLDIMKTTSDGYKIAERDLQMRGPGEFFSSNSDFNMRQSGGFSFPMASLCDDPTLFSKAFSDAKALLSADPALSLPEHEKLKAELGKLLSDNDSAIS